MRIAVIGAGIVGVATAHELALAGAEVSVYERRGSVAAEASFASGGLVAPGQLAPWPEPLPFDRRALGHLPWWWRRWLSRATPRQALYHLAVLSRERMLELTRSLDLEYEQNPGCLVLLRHERELKALQARLPLLRDWGVAHELVDATRARTLEPGLGEAAPVLAALHLPQDGVGNCRQFAHLLKAQAQRHGARFHFDREVRGVVPGPSPEVVLTDGERGAFDHVVVCAGADALALLAPLKLRLPLLPVYGHAVTAPLRPIEGLPLPGPRGVLVDHRHRITLSRLGQRVRVAGLAEFGGVSDQPSLPALRTLYRVLEEWFPGAAALRDAQHWKGARPMLPDQQPVLGASGLPGLWLNLGHGEAGWALACGSARVLAACVAGQPAPVDLQGLTLDRWR